MKAKKLPRKSAEWSEMMKTQCRERIVKSKKGYTKKDRRSNKVKFL